MSSIWKWIARHGPGIQRQEEWSALLGDQSQSWVQFLDKVSDPVGLTFFARLGGGEEEYELTRGDGGFLAIPTTGGAPRELNPTQAVRVPADRDRRFHGIVIARSRAS